MEARVHAFARSRCRARLTCVALSVLLSFCFHGVSAQPAPTVIAHSGHNSLLSALLIPDHGRWLATGSKDGSIKLWDTASGRLIRTLIGHRSEIDDLAMMRDGRRIVSVGNDATTRIWDADNGELLQTNVDSRPLAGNDASSFNPRRLTVGSGDRIFVRHIQHLDSARSS